MVVKSPGWTWGWKWKWLLGCWAFVGESLHLEASSYLRLATLRRHSQKITRAREYMPIQKFTSQVAFVSKKKEPLNIKREVIIYANNETSNRTNSKQSFDTSAAAESNSYHPLKENAHHTRRTHTVPDSTHQPTFSPYERESARKKTT